MNKDQIIAFRAKWGIPYRVLADKIGITPKNLNDKFNGKAKQTLNATNINKLNEVLKEMSGDMQHTLINWVAFDKDDPETYPKYAGKYFVAYVLTIDNVQIDNEGWHEFDGKWDEQLCNFRAPDYYAPIPTTL